jgi:ribosomal protein S18 acetylase RimI-like enzyme
MTRPITLSIRPTTPDDTPALLELTAGTGFFKPSEVQALNEVLNDYHAANREAGHLCYTWAAEGEPILGYVYYAPAAMTDRTWYLYWIAVRKTGQGSGVGTKLLTFAETDMRTRGGRVLFIETSSVPMYEPTRKFYLKHGYEINGQLRDYYREGDDMVVFRKHL